MERTRDLTEGSVPGRLLAFFFPMLVTNLLQQLYAVADTAIVGWGLGDGALAAVGNMAPLSLVIIGFSTGMTSGFSVPIAQRFGARDGAALRRAIAASVRLALLLAAGLTAAGLLGLGGALRAMRTDASIFEESLRYGGIIVGGLAVTMAYNLCACILRALGDSRTPLIAIVASSAVNIALDAVCILGLGMGVESAAAATIAAQGVSALICAGRLRKIEAIRFSRGDFAPERETDAALLRNALPMALMNSVTGVGDMTVQSAINSLGVACTSAYAVCGRYLNLFMLPGITASFALSAFVGQNAGAGKRARIREGVRVGCAIAAVSAALLGGAMLLLPVRLSAFMLRGEEAIALCAGYLRVCGAALILLNLMFVFRGSVQGLGKPAVPMASGLLEMALRIALIALLLPRLGFTIAAAANVVAWIGALSLNAGAYARLMRGKS